MTRTTRGTLVALTIIALLSGCLEGTPDNGTSTARGSDRDNALGGAAEFSYECPPGPNATVNSLCVGRLVDRFQSNVEPYLAVHPANSDVMAIGVNTYQPLEAVQVSAPEVRVAPNAMAFYFTEDGGASWRRETLPYVSIAGATNPTPVQMGFAGDPAMEFDADGVLHMSALVSSNGLAPVIATIGVIYTSTPDLGRTWTPAVTLASDTSNDRNWITVNPDGRIYVPWQNPGASSEVAWSLDNGKTWKGQEPGQVADGCPTVSIVVVHEGTPLFACYGQAADGSADGLRVYEFDDATGNVKVRATLDAMPCIWPQLTLLADGSLAIVGEACGSQGDLRISRSADGGRTWREPLSVTPATKSKVDITMWLRGDPWGNLHLLATAGYGDLEHVVFDGATFLIVHEEILRPGPPGGPPTEPSEGLPLISGGDHYYGIVFSERGGFLAWARDYGVDYARLGVGWNPRASNTI